MLDAGGNRIETVPRHELRGVAQALHQRCARAHVLRPRAADVDLPIGGKPQALPEPLGRLDGTSLAGVSETERRR